VTEALLHEFRARELSARVAVGGGFIFAAQHDAPETIAATRDWLEARAADLEGDGALFVTAALQFASLPKFKSRYMAQAVGRSRRDLLTDVWTRLAGAAGDRGAESTAALLAMARLKTFDSAQPLGTVPELVEILEDPSSPPEHVVLALEAVGSPFLPGWVATPTPLDVRTTEAVGRLLRHADARVRLAVIQTLRYTGGAGLPSELHEVFRELAGDDKPEIRTIVAEALPVEGTWTDVLDALTNDSDPSVRASAFRTASRHPDGEELLYEALGSADAERRRLAANALAYTQPSDRLVPLLVHMTESPEVAERLVALRALGNVPDAEIRALVRIGAEDDDVGVRALTAESLSPLDETDETVLIRLTTDGDGRVREAALRTLAQSPHGRSRQAMLDGLSDPLEPVQQVATQSLVSTADPDLVRAAIEHLRRSRLQGLYISVPRTVPEDQAGLYAELLEVVDDRTRGEILAGVARGREVADADLTILSIDLDGISPFLDPLQPVSEDRIDDVAELENVDREDVRARYRALAEQIGIMAPDWA
jgi:HEAT repeat protein